MLELNKRLKGEKIVEFYTDRAIAVNSEEKNKIGIDWIAKIGDRLANEISFSSSIVNWLSSTHAELEAIWSALLATSVRTQVHIYTDSKAAIEAIKKYKENNKLHS